MRGFSDNISLRVCTVAIFPTVRFTYRRSFPSEPLLPVSTQSLAHQTMFFLEQCADSHSCFIMHWQICAVKTLFSPKNDPNP